MPGQTGRICHPMSWRGLEAPEAGLGQGALELGPLQGAAAHLVGEAAHNLPAVLAADVGVEALDLSLEREGLVLLVGRDSRVRGDVHNDVEVRTLPAVC